MDTTFSFNSLEHTNIDKTSISNESKLVIKPAIKIIKKINQLNSDSKLTDKEFSHLSKLFAHQLYLKSLEIESINPEEAYTFLSISAKFQDKDALNKMSLTNVQMEINQSSQIDENHFTQALWKKVNRSKKVHTKLKYLEELMNKNDLKAKHELAVFIQKNLIPCEYNSVELLEECVENLYVPSYFALARYYFSKESYSKAEEYYKAVLDNPKIHPNDSLLAKFELAKIYINHLTENFDIGKGWLKENADNGHSNSVNLLKELDDRFKNLDEKNIVESQIIHDLKTLDQQVHTYYHGVIQGIDYSEQIRCPKNTSVNYPNLHANYADFHPFYFIVMKHPLSNEYDFFWELCLQHRTLIVDLTNSDDVKKNKLFDYAPRMNLNHNANSESLNAQKISSNIRFIEFKIQDKYNSMKQVDIPKIHYLNWTEDTTPDYNELTILVQEIVKYKSSANQRIIVHSIKGTDSTMTLVVACRLYNLIQNAHHTFFNKNENPDATLIQTLKQLIFMARKSRGNNVINEGQRNFLFYWGRSLLYSFKEKASQIS
ncbi:MAG: protein-tyrosine phosphatase family protein [Parachlamydiaceae bacterium]|nr:protein-tyrosine phosphatase family protein [Parachlamydiaceae bacterium]